jgi:hypothetical protein
MRRYRLQLGVGLACAGLCLVAACLAFGQSTGIIGGGIFRPAASGSGTIASQCGVDGCAAVQSTSTSTITLTPNFAPGTGTFVALYIYFGGAISGLTLSDNNGTGDGIGAGTYPFVAGPSSGQAMAYYQFPSAPSATTYTASWTTSRGVLFVEDGYTGVNSYVSGTSATATSGAPSISQNTTYANDWVTCFLGNISVGNITTTAGTERYATSSGSVRGNLIDAYVATAGNAGTCSGTMTSGQWRALIMELKSN